ncbi:hypothetical protein DFH27DRAFT_501918, partial [Peziza echinospora]
MTAPDASASVTAQEYIRRQLELEREAREVMPYSFETCTHPLGPLRQPVFACHTHSAPGKPAALCYSCSISCHGDCELVELFAKRDIVCDCGTSRIPAVPCSLRPGAASGDEPAKGNRYCHNYEGRFCACDSDYDVAKETGTMYQCLLGDACNEDWFHDACIVGEKRVEAEDGDVDGDIKMEADEEQASIPAQAEGGEEEEEEDDDEDDDRPPNFPAANTFEAFICWLCVAKHPWLRNYAGKPGFLPAVIKKDAIPPPPQAKPEPEPNSTDDTKPPLDPSSSSDTSTEPTTNSRKRKASPSGGDDSGDTQMQDAKRVNVSPPPTSTSTTTSTTTPPPTITTSHTTCTLPPPTSPHPPTTPISLFLTHPPHLLPTPFCACPQHAHPLLTSPHPEETYEPPLSPTPSSSNAPSILDMGERALNAIPRARAIDGVNAYIKMKEKVTEFLRPFAAEGREVGEEDVKEYFRRLRGDVEGAGGSSSGSGSGGDGRREQSGY